jgi:hypothetical protein
MQSTAPRTLQLCEWLGPEVIVQTVAKVEKTRRGLRGQKQARKPPCQTSLGNAIGRSRYVNSSGNFNSLVAIQRYHLGGTANLSQERLAM